jgi:hypothetical protein
MVSLAKRLATVVATRSNSGCVTCAWLQTLSDGDRIAWDQWIAEGRSLAQLHEVASSDTDNPLNVSLTAVRMHQRHHRVYGS